MAGTGYQRNRYRYQAPTVTTDGAGQASISWSDVVTIAGMVNQNQAEVLDDLGVAVRTDVVIETAYHPSVSAKGRLVDVATDAIYNIRGVVDPDGGRKRRLRVTAVAIDEAYAGGAA